MGHPMTPEKNGHVTTAHPTDVGNLNDTRPRLGRPSVVTGLCVVRAFRCHALSLGIKQPGKLQAQQLPQTRLRHRLALCIVRVARLARAKQVRSGDTTSELKAVKGVKRTFPDWESLKTAMFPQPTLGVHRIPVKLRAACLLQRVTA